MTTRSDVSAVPMQGGYVAKQCPVRAQNDTLRPSEPLPPSPVMERMFARGRDFETDVVAELVRLRPDAAVVDRGEASDRETATSRSIADGATLILGGRLPNDPIGRRVGEPDLLVAADAGGYRAIDIKHHQALELTEPPGKGLAGLCSSLDDVSLERARPDEASARKHKGDLLQLAHYQRMLEAAGHAASDGRHGGIVGVERRVVWFDLDAPIWRTPSASGKPRMRSTMEIYDFEFDFRLDIIARAQAFLAGRSTEPLLVPVRIGECDACPWWGHCRPQLETGSGDVSLIPRIGWREWKAHRDRGVTDRAALASLDVRTARLVAAGIDVAELLALTEAIPPETPISDLPAYQRRTAKLAELRETGVGTAGDVRLLDGPTAAYSGAGLSSLPEQIDRARAATGSRPVYRRRGVDAISVPRADVEVDIDMENVEEGVYLWGALLTDRSGAGLPDGYRPFVTWESLLTDAQTRNFSEFWSWLMQVRADASAAGRTFLAYCYHASAENTFLRSLGAATGSLEEIERFIDSDQWIDMLRVFDDQLITGGSSGLKMVAPLAGFSWEVDDPGGAGSMLRYEVATRSPTDVEREAARAWLLTYNRGDVEATRAIRDWMERDAGGIDSIERSAGA